MKINEDYCRSWVRATVMVLATAIINHFGTEKPFGAKFVVMLLKTVNTQYIYYTRRCFYRFSKKLNLLWEIRKHEN